MKKFSVWRFLFALVLAAAAVYLWCVLQQGEKFTVRHISDGLFFATAVDILYGCEFLHTFLGFRATNAGNNVANAYWRVQGDMTYSTRSDRFFISEFLIIGIMAGAAGALLLLLR